ncbi:hypothetical protein FLL45_20040 [Aliikangiella marina]|uniref:Uncharacterized protein n=1 Tax=Aliikangiella marina TaxID=1712262 RepID=A0A545T2K9_9GAMM|nr:hypothetical protein [Aliikangiella marina]TQV71448.1 hypothetical protein FLL45_20040 [Aliikangiella marina]
MNKILVFGLSVFIMLFPLGVSAAEKSNMIVLISIPIALVTFIVCISLALMAKKKEMLIAIGFLNLPNWLFCLKTLLVGLAAGATDNQVIFITMACVIFVSSIIPFWVLIRRKGLLEETNTEG